MSTIFVHYTVLYGSRCEGRQEVGLLRALRDILLSIFSEQMLSAVRSVAGQTFIYQQNNPPTSPRAGKTKVVKQTFRFLGF